MKLPSARVQCVLDSIAPCGVRLTTFECEWPRYMHADFMTHRELSRCGRSSRAEPVMAALERAEDDPVEPLVWMYDERGMQHGTVMDGDDLIACQEEWALARKNAIGSARRLWARRLHRQYLLRIVEPFLRIKMVISATSWDNFLALRFHPAPMPEIQQLASQIGRFLHENKPNPLCEGEWHLPYVNRLPHWATWLPEERIKLSVAMCARVSFDHLGESKGKDADFATHDRLLMQDPVHASPGEHQAMATGDPDVRSGNFHGWIQYRHTIKGESKRPGEFDLASRIVQYEGNDYLV
jgi:hypothetical protein